jgi:hypothetical protein
VREKRGDGGMKEGGKNLGYYIICLLERVSSPRWDRVKLFKKTLLTTNKLKNENVEFKIQAEIMNKHA